MNPKKTKGMALIVRMAMAITILSMISCEKDVMQGLVSDYEIGSKLQFNEPSQVNQLNIIKSRFTSNDVFSKEAIETITKETNQVFARSTELLEATIASSNSQRKKNNHNVISVPGDYANLQEAIDNAQPGAKIVVKGVLKNQGEVTVMVPNLKIIGDQDDIHWKKDDDNTHENDREKSVIKGTSINLMAENIRISHLILKIRVIINTQATGAKILHNRFKSDVSDTGETESGIILMNDVSRCSIGNNIIKIHNNTANTTMGAISYGIYAAGCSENKFYNNTIIGSDNTLGHMFLNNSVNNKIVNCTVKNGGNLMGAGIYFVDGYFGNLVSGCVVKNLNNSGIFFNNLNGAGDNNKIIDCIVRNYRGERIDGQGNFVSYGIRIENGTANMIRDSRVTGPGQRSVLDEGIGILFATSSTIEGCVSKNNSGGGITIFGNGGVNKITNCIASGNGGNLSNGTLSSYGILYYGNFPNNGSVLIEECTASGNTDLNLVGSDQGFPGAIMVVDVGGSIDYTISNCKAMDNTGVTSVPGESPGMGILAYVFPYFSTGGVKLNLTNNATRKNNYGISLINSTSATLSTNKSKNNTMCDYREVNSSGTVLSDNQFGTICEEL